MRSTKEKFLSKVMKTATCWLWTGYRDRGYGVISIGVGMSQKRHQAHRLAYELFKGPIPAGLHIHHLCHNPFCVNPDHLQAIAQGLHGRLHNDKYLHELKQIRLKQLRTEDFHRTTPEVY